MKIIIDDVCQSIDCEDFEITIPSPANFHLTLEKILTVTQFENYIGRDTNRIFIISNKRFSYLEDLYNKQQAIKKQNNML